MSKKKKENEWVVYPVVNPTVDKLKEYFKMQENDKLNPEELQTPKLATLPVDPTADIQDVSGASEEDLGKLKEHLQETLDKLDADDLDKKNYVKISPTFYLQSVKNEDKDDETELFKILNPEEGTVETRELTDEEKKELFITELKRSRIKFNPLSHPTKTVGTEMVVSSIGRERVVKIKEPQTNKIINQFDTGYKKKRKRRNKLAKASRKANR